jgi:hypothetical protein
MESLVAKAKHLQEELPLFCIANPILKRLLVFSAGCSFFQVDDFTEKDLLFRLLMETPFDS